MGFAAALLVARLRRRSHHGIQQQGLDDVEKSREPMVQGMLLEMTPRGLRERWVVVTSEHLTISHSETSLPSFIIPIECIEKAEALHPGHHPLGKKRMDALQQAELDLKASTDMAGHDLDLTNGIFVLHLYGGGLNHDHEFVTSGLDMRDWWLEGIHNAQANNTKERVTRPISKLTRVRGAVRHCYESATFQIFIAALIFFNFVMQCVQMQMLPAEDSDWENFFEVIENVCTVIYLVELLINIFATWFTDFVSSGWNWFDVLVIGGSVYNSFWLAGGSGQGARSLYVLRLLRACRVARLLRRMPSVRKLLEALIAAIPPVSNSMGLMAIVISMYAVIGVSFFSGGSGTYFSSYLDACFTLFQASTGDNWGDVVRELWEPYNDDNSNEGRLFVAGVSLYFVSFMVIVSIVLMQVVIAVLLEEFSRISDKKASGGLSYSNYARRPNPFRAYFPQLMSANDAGDLHRQCLLIFSKIVYHARCADQHEEPDEPRLVPCSDADGWEGCEEEQAQDLAAAADELASDSGKDVENKSNDLAQDASAAPDASAGRAGCFSCLKPGSRGSEALSSEAQGKDASDDGLAGTNNDKTAATETVEKDAAAQVTDDINTATLGPKPAGADEAAVEGKEGDAGGDGRSGTGAGQEGCAQAESRADGADQGGVASTAGEQQAAPAPAGASSDKGDGSEPQQGARDGERVADAGEAGGVGGDKETPAADKDDGAVPAPGRDAGTQEQNGGEQAAEKKADVEEEAQGNGQDGTVSGAGEEAAADGKQDDSKAGHGACKGDDQEAQVQVHGGSFGIDDAGGGEEASPQPPKKKMMRTLSYASSHVSRKAIDFQVEWSGADDHMQDRLSFHDLQIGLRALELKPPAIFTADDWEKYVVRNGLADEDDCIGDAREGGRVRRAKK